MKETNRDALFPDEAMRALESQATRTGKAGKAADARPAPASSWTVDDWLLAIEREPAGNRSNVAEQAVQAFPTDAEVLLSAAFAAAAEDKPDASLRYLKRLTKHYAPNRSVWACEAIALAESGRWPMAQAVLSRHNLLRAPAFSLFPPSVDWRWGESWLRRIGRWKPQGTESGKAKRRPEEVSRKRAETALKPSPSEPATTPDSPPAPVAPALPPVRPTVALAVSLPDAGAFAILGDAESESRQEDFRTRHDFDRLSLLRGFDDLLCIPHLRGVDHYWYQVETVKKVLRQFRGRVLLADEVGLGKTIEAGMVLKEYLLRGMAKRVLILTPPSLVGQWREEMLVKFGIEFASTHDAAFHREPSAFWAGERIIASIAAARLTRHLDYLAANPFDLVIVDEAHHLKNRASLNWKLVDSLKKRFLLLLSATPVQNNLVELYNLLTLLKPGLFRTEKEFRSSYMKPGHPRAPVNREALQDLMRDAMIRNTRALVDVRLPPRQAMTIRVDPVQAERECYEELSRLIRVMREEDLGRHHLSVHHLLQAAGSSPAAAVASLAGFVEKGASEEWRQLLTRYAAIPASAKTQALLHLLDRNPGEKKMIFVRYRETLNLLDALLREKGMPFSRFDGQMSGPQKDLAIEEFRTDTAILLCTESGGEGRNVQFCNTLVNYDLHWNPQMLEQRIGRIHRIGQQRDVFIFNLAMKDTVEDKILAILDEKINMFELVVGEMQSILGEMEDEKDFGDLVFAAWVRETADRREQAFEELGDKLLQARQEYEKVKECDEQLFGDEFEVV